MHNQRSVQNKVNFAAEIPELTGGGERLNWWASGGIWEPDHLQWQSQYRKMPYNIVTIDYNIVVVATIIDNGLQ